MADAGQRDARAAGVGVVGGHEMSVLWHFMMWVYLPVAMFALGWAWHNYGGAR